MNKLRNKLFIIIFMIFTIFSFSIIFTLNIKEYNREYNKINQILKLNTELKYKMNDNPMRFLDNTIYSVIIDKNDNILDIISHERNGRINDDLTKQINKIIKSNKIKYIGNLYFNKYSYIKNENIITIIDNSNTNNSLLSSIKTSILIFVLVEFISYILSNVITNYVMKPIIETFNKQKEFVTDASHELKTPLAVIMASADALEKNNKEKKFINNIQIESERMNKLITNLLDLSKIENKTVFENINLSKLIEKSTLTFESLIYENNIKLEYNISENIFLDANSEEIKQLMSILLDNAIKHSTKKGKIIVDLYKYKNSIVLDVKNTGEAIPKEEEEKIFERFYRIDKSRNRNENRYGLGLAIAKSIVVKHNGTISAHSDNKITTFKVIFKNKLFIKEKLWK